MSGRSALGILVQKLAYRSRLEESDREALLALPHRISSVDAFHHLIREREDATHCCLMISGFSIRHKVVVNGARQIVAIHMRGDMVDLQNAVLGTADHSVQMLTAGEVAMIPRNTVEQIALEHPRVGMAMWKDTLVDASVFREWIANVGRRDSATRMAHLLCEFALRLKVAGLGERTGYQLPMTQEQLADTLGLTPVHVNRTLQTLQQQNLISRHKRWVQIEEWQRLANAGDFDPTYLHLHEDEAPPA